MLTFDEALARVLALGSVPLSAEEVPLALAVGRVLAEDLLAPGDLPAFDHSAMDGYAVAARDLPHPGLALRIVGESRAGSCPGPLVPGTTMRIFTGAPLPLGADAVVMQEHVSREGDLATFADAATAFQFVRRRGADARAGSVVLPKGTRLRPAHLACAATVDQATVSVVRRPIVTVLATGDELRPPGSSPRPGTIPDANTPALIAMAERAGATCTVHPIVSDDREATERAFREALHGSDVLVTTGGVSVGDHDVVRPALAAVGVELDFWRVAIKPGKPLCVGQLRSTNEPPTRALVFGVPGNPASAIVTFALFGVPLLRALQGDASPFPPRLRATLTSPFAHAPGRLELARARLDHGPDGLRATVLPNQASGAVTSMAMADALVLVPADSRGLEAGDPVDVLALTDLAL